MNKDYYFISYNYNNLNIIIYIKKEIMTRVHYSERPNVFTEFSNGAVIYCWDIQEEEMFHHMEMEGEVEMPPTIQYSCFQVTIHQPISKEKLTKAVITEVWDNELEKKLVNDYNGAKSKLFDTATNTKYINAYNEFLVSRKALKDQIDLDWGANY